MIVVAIAVVAFVVFLSSLNWRRSINIVFVVIVFEGALRKWVVPEFSDALYFLKDFILIGAYWKYFFNSSHEPKYRVSNNWINLLIFGSFAFSTFQALNPALGSPIVGILGMKAYFIYIPLIWIFPTIFRSEQELINFLRWNLLLVIPVCLIGIFQYLSPADSWINQYAPGDIDTIALNSSGSVRITGTFSYINSYQGYLIAIFAIALPLAFMPQNLTWQAITMGELALILGNSFMTGSRTPVYTELVVGVGYFASLFLTQPKQALRVANNFAIPTVLATPLIIRAFDKAIEAFSDRANKLNDFNERLNRTINEPLAYTGTRDGFGYGIGATHAGGGALKKIFGISEGQKVLEPNEAEPGRVMLELGPIGFLLWYGLRISIIITLLFRYFQLKSPLLKSLCLTACLLQAVQIPGQLVFHHTFGLYYWFFSSFIFTFPQIEMWENWYAQQRQANFTAPISIIPSGKNPTQQISPQ